MPGEFDIAIVGMACRFPGARTLHEFWDNLDRGVESITRFSDEEMRAAGVPAELLTRPGYVKAAPVIDQPEYFDAAFFGYTAQEATVTDPQQRLLLELSHAAFEDAGIDPARYRGHAGVFAGSAHNTYLVHTGLGGVLVESYIPTLIANDKDFLATRISYHLGLRGPSLTVQTACSTSLVALHLARQSLLNEETDLALAAAISIRVPHHAGYLYDGSGVVSPEGRVRAFDASANGTVFGSGAGVLVLKRLSDALAQGDRVHAVIKGSAVNNDGCGKAAYTAPSVDGQAAVVVEALANAGVDASDLTYLEAHGSGTPVGDRIELLALTKAFRKFTSRKNFCAIGSVKTNVGHLDAAAGMAGLIKTVLALQHRRLPASLNFREPNPEIDFPATPFFVNAAGCDWSPAGAPRRAGVMATGMGGTNAFVVLEEAPESASALASPVDEVAPQLLVFSAKTPSALETLSRKYATFLSALDSAAGDTLPAVAHTLQSGRSQFAQRRFVVGRTRAEAAAALAKPAAKGTVGQVAREGAPPVVFLLSGMGDHYAGMGRELYARFGVFREEIDHCVEILRPLLGLDLREVLFPPVAAAGAPAARGIDLKRMLAGGGGDSGPPAEKSLDDPLLGQSALFAIEYALARLWLSWGVRPERLVGHSMGEYVAACLAGVFSVADALHLLVTRARLVAALPRGAMLAVMLPEGEIRPLLEGEVSIALINGPKLCVVAGSVPDIARLETRLKTLGAIFRPVRNSHPFHSRLLDGIVAPFTEQVKRVSLSAPQIPFISNVTGTWITAAQAVDPAYWAEHARQTARFGDALARVWDLPERTLLEIGPGRTLGVLAMQHPARPAKRTPVILSSLRHGYENQPDVEVLLHNLGRLWLTGIDLSLDSLVPAGARRRISLPGYPFERQRYWIEASASPRAKRDEAHSDLADWFYVPSWRRTSFAPASIDTGKSARPLWLILADEPAIAEQLCDCLVARDAEVVVARFGSSPARKAEDAWEVRSGCLDDYLALLAALQRRAAGGLNIIHLGAVSPRVKLPGAGHESPVEELGFHSLMTLAQAVGEKNFTGPVQLAIVTSQAHEVTGFETLNPLGGLAVGLCGVLAKEYPAARVFALDLPVIARGDEWVPHILDEFNTAPTGGVIAYRGRFRWERAFVPEKLPAAASGQGSGVTLTGLRTKGVYLITGGTGGLGLAVARELAANHQARLVLTKKSPFPLKSEWRTRLMDGALPSKERRQIEALLELETLGAEVEVRTCDVCDAAGMRTVISDTLAKHGALHGVIHTAGLLEEGVIQLKSRAVSEAVLAPKVRGTLVLFDLVRDLPLDVFVLFSSLSSVVGFHGQSDYCAANAFLDAFAHYARAHAAFPTVAVDWPVWREVGILTESRIPASLEARREAVRRRAISTKDGVEIFRRAIAARWPQVTVCPRDLDAVLREAAQPISDRADTLSASSPPSAVLASSAADAPRDEVEKVVAAAWSEALGLSPIGVHDSFLALGGHSLMAMRIVAQLRAVYQVNFTLRQFFETPTVAGHALAIHAAVLAEIESEPEEAVPVPAS